MNYKSGILLGAALAGLTFTSCMSAKTQMAEKAEGECHGINACKGQGDCGGKGHACAGKNSCKGQGWKGTSEKECAEKGGKFVKT
ncbi:hypothetical protein EHQ23_00500 [Leptospira bourretii]|uniref:Lipoprotein n=1 Tax=Leptospira bourretii TaxID=2484962 RepID=A0A4R9IPT2_9LEPT|nr:MULTISPECIES: hypothetical protein [Leptospira]MCG6139884.1 hypothetical protein [Leptospira mtsangambouensis]TGK90079.1 hypothetical protein EHQ23_00500 [Leptospira bourretii]TGK93899.1 hypothetical protein EHQ26_07710 [Leptospira bourretii]TGL22903.1 hypothetical protein EHQ47_09135 [Leptospira bourretii]TGL29237.1 hypothetical protein EHQ45_15190 [Leptospira bourretii]